ncbi:MAG TPA: phasin family protein [Rubrivivax sp.]|nr:phasin family protein [Burkholderiales bacterium]HNU10192.1 phasin family protein [Rubrivivax sp.]
MAKTARKPKNVSTKKSRASSSGLLDNQLAQLVKDSAQQIWLAGMGAFGKAQQEGGKFFETLVKEGVNLQRRTQGMAEDKINEVTGRMSAMAGTVTAKAGQNWDKLESIFEQRTAKAMTKLGVPSAKDVEVLTQRVEELAAAVARLAKATGVGSTKAASKTAAKTARAAAKSATGEPKAAAKRAPRKAAAA